jgi:hypothetical protein
MTRHPAQADPGYRMALDGSIEAMRQSDSTRQHEGTDMTDPGSYHCTCGWSRIILDGQTLEDARRIHEGTAIHAIETQSRYLLVYPQGDVDRVEVLSIEGKPVESFDPVPRLGPDGDVDTYATVRFPSGTTRTVLTLDLIDLNDESEEL